MNDEKARVGFLAAEAREKAIWDYNQTIYEAEQRGEQHGIEKTVKSLLTLGVSVDIIAEATKLPIAQIEARKE